MLLSLTDFTDLPLHRQVSRQIAERIMSGELSVGTALPSARSLARKQRISIRTAERAQEELKRLGVVSEGADRQYVVAPVSDQLRHRLLQAHQGDDSYRSAPQAYVKPSSSFSSKELEILEVLVGQSGVAPGAERFDGGSPERLRIEEELSRAGEIQRSLLPSSMPRHAVFETAAMTEPCRSIGGDFYDAVSQGSGRWLFLIGDACGKGLPASLLASQVQAVLKTESHPGKSPPQVLNRLNRYLCRYSSTNNFATLFLALFDVRSGQLDYGNAGHFQPILCRASGRIELLDSTGPPIGILPETNYGAGRRFLRPGDVLLMYTDGVTEETHRQRGDYGLKRLVKVVRASRKLPAEKILTALLEDLAKFVEATGPADDRTAVVLKIRPERGVACS